MKTDCRVYDSPFKLVSVIGRSNYTTKYFRHFVNGYKNDDIRYDLHLMK